MSQNKMVQSVIGRQQEETWQEIERKDCGKKEEIGDFLSIDTKPKRC
jgi:hypothetical protein